MDISPALPESWPLTMSAMARHFLTAGADFLARLLRVLPGDVNDEEIATAVHGATKKKQHSEALWLTTVPTALENLRREAKRKHAAESEEIARMRKSATPEENAELDRILHGE